MWRKKRKTILVVILLIFPVFLATLLLVNNPKADAASTTYQYCGINGCGNGGENTAGTITECAGSNCDGSSFILTSSSGDTTTWTNDNQGGSIVVDICKPSLGLYEPSAGNGKAAYITIGGSYANASATGEGAVPYPTCGGASTSQTIIVNLNFTNVTPDLSGEAETLGPATVTLENSSGKVIQTAQTNSDPSAGQSSTDELTTANQSPPGFTNVAPDNYKVCTTGIEGNPCTNVTKGEFNNIITATLSGTPNSTIISANSTSNNSSTPTCESTGGQLSWLTCAIIDGIVGAEKSLENLLQDFLKTSTIDFNSSDCQSGTASQNYTACVDKVWSAFRDYGDVVLVIAVLVAIIAEAIGGGVIEAYTVKRMLPRVLLVAILINLSIYLVAGLMDITNIVGNGLNSLLTAPFGNTGTFHINISAATGNLFGAGSLLAGLGAAGGIWKLASVGGLGDAISFLALFVALPVLLAILGVVLTIFFRQTILILLLMTSPIAFALYCLPNTEQYFKKWWDLLFKALLVYPIVMVVFAMCDLGAVIVSSFPATGQEQWLGELMAIVGVAAPLFLIPFAFKMSGGAIGSIHGALTNFNNKATEAIKGNANDPNSMRRRIARNFTTRRAAAGLSWGAIGTRINPRQVTRRGRTNAAARLSAHRQAGLEQLRRETEETALFRASQGDSNIMRELAWYKNGREARQASDNWRQGQINDINSKQAKGQLTQLEASEARQEVERKYGQRNAAIAVAERINYNPANRRAAFLNQYQVGFEMEEGEKGWNHAVAIMDDISGGDDFQFRSLMDEYQAVAKGPAGRVDQAANTNGDRAYNGNKAWNNGSLYEIGMGKATAVSGAAEYYAGVAKRLDTGLDRQRDADFFKEAEERQKAGETNITARDVAAEATGAFYSEQSQLAQNAKGAIRDAALAAKRSVGNDLAASTYIRDNVSRRVQAGEFTAQAGDTMGDMYAKAKEVRDRARVYETPEQVAARGGGAGGQQPGQGGMPGGGGG